MIEKTISTIKETFKSNALVPQQSIEEAVANAMAENENNVRIEGVSNSGQKWLLKYSLVHLNPKIQHTGIRAKLNLRNEANFYRLSNNIKKEHVIIPQLLNSSQPEAEEPWIIMEKLLPEDVFLFPRDQNFLTTPYPDFFIESVVAGIAEFQNMPIPKDIFNVQTLENTLMWLKNLDGAFTNRLADKKAEVIKAFDTYTLAWQENTKYISHNDIQPDTLGYQRKTKKLVLLDFEKVQITHHALDYTGISQNPTWTDWNSKFEKALFAHYNDNNFSKLYYLSCVLKTVTNLNNFKTGRLDHVFINILGKDAFDKAKIAFIPLWEDAFLSYLEKLK